MKTYNITISTRLSKFCSKPLAASSAIVAHFAAAALLPLYLFTFLLLIGCSDDPDKVLLQLTDSPMSVTGITPAQGYAGGTFAITGSNFGASDQLIEVQVGGTECTIVSCSNSRIVARVPQGVTTGQVSVGIKTQSLIQSDYTFTVITPQATADNAQVYLGTTLTISGTQMPPASAKSDIKVYFGTTEAKINDYTVDGDGNGQISVTVPNTLAVGTATLRATLYSYDFLNQNVTILETPTVESLDGQFVSAGTLTIHGTGFSSFAGNVKVSFAGQEAEATVVSDNELTVSIPSSFETGGVTIMFGSEISPISLGTPTVVRSGDVTDLFLKNSISPLQYDSSIALSRGWTTPTGWTVNGSYTGLGYEPSTEWFGAKAIAQTYPQNAKMYQVVTMPAGSYTLRLTVEKCANTRGRFGAYLMVTIGSGTLPDLSDRVRSGGGWLPENDGDVIASYRITDNKTTTAETRTLDFTLTEQQQVTIGFVYQLNGDGQVQMSSLKIEKK